MILDARDLPRNLHDIETDLCIVGAGPAALVIGRELASAGVRLTMLESGGHAYEQTSQDLNAGGVVGAAYDDLRSVRRRQLGGTVNSWNTYIGDEIAAKYAPLDVIDFEHRDWLPHSGWPFDAADLEPWYRKAQAICGLGPLAYDARDWIDDRFAPPLRLEDSGITTKIYQFGTAAALVDAQTTAIRDSAHAQLLLHATVTELKTYPLAERIAAALVVVRGRRDPIRVTAQVFVLACGGIENARLLLLSDDTRPAGLGNEHGWVGRCFMEHPRDYALTLLPARDTFLTEAHFYDQHDAAHGGVVMGRLAIAADALREARALQASATLLPIWRTPSPLLRILRSRKRNQGSRDAAYPRGGAGWSRRSAGTEMLSGVRLLLNLEQAPSPHNRITLSADRDELGSRKTQLHWTWTEPEQRQLENTRRRFADALESAKYGKVHVETKRRPDPNAHHHAGTTRMHRDPQLGVVDADARVHGVENLFVAGGSVFPTAGFANPTLTIVALAARLAAHLKNRLAPASDVAANRSALT